MKLTPSSIKRCLSNVLSKTQDNISKFVNNPGRDMTRNRACSFKDTFLLTCSFSAKRTNTELLEYFTPQNRHVPSKSALSQQRSKFHADLFPHIFKAFNDEIPFQKLCYGLHLVAVDGSDLNLPTDKNDHIYAVKQARSENSYYQMHLNAMFDLCENRYCALKIQPRPQMNEGSAFRELIDAYPVDQKTLFIADRGYISLSNMAHVIEKGHFFLIRAKAPDSSGSILKHLLETNTEVDKTVTIGITRSKCKEYVKNPSRYRVLRKGSEFQWIPSEDRSSVYDMKFRCLSIRLDNGTYEYLVTNLPQKKFPMSVMKELYAKRWGIETSFRSLKYACSLTYLHSVKRSLIIQEIYAKLILYNFASLLHRYAQTSLESRPRRNPHKVSFDDAVPIARLYLSIEMRNRQIKTLLQRNLTEVRGSRHNERNVRSQRANPLNNRA